MKQPREPNNLFSRSPYLLPFHFPLLICKIRHNLIDFRPYIFNLYSYIGQDSNGNWIIWSIYCLEGNVSIKKSEDIFQNYIHFWSKFQFRFSGTSLNPKKPVPQLIPLSVLAPKKNPAKGPLIYHKSVYENSLALGKIKPGEIKKSRGIVGSDKGQTSMNVNSMRRHDCRHASARAKKKGGEKEVSSFSVAGESERENMGIYIGIEIYGGGIAGLDARKRIALWCSPPPQHAIPDSPAHTREPASHVWISQTAESSPGIINTAPSLVIVTGGQ